MNINPDLNKLQQLKSAFEGFENIAYPDTGGVWTVGSGHTWNYDRERKVKVGDTISRETDARWLGLKYDSLVKEISKYIKVQLNPDQSAAIVDYCYNRGVGNFLKTQLDELINANPNSDKVTDEIKMTGLRDRAGNLLWGLGRRRRAQAHLYKTGQLKFDWPRWG